MSTPNILTCTVRFGTLKFTDGVTTNTLPDLIDYIATELDVKAQQIRFEDGHTCVTVHDLVEMYDVCRRFDPSVPVWVEFQNTGEHGMDTISLTLDD